MSVECYKVGFVFEKNHMASLESTKVGIQYYTKLKSHQRGSSDPSFDSLSPTESNDIKIGII